MDFFPSDLLIKIERSASVQQTCSEKERFETIEKIQEIQVKRQDISRIEDPFSLRQQKYFSKKIF